MFTCILDWLNSYHFNLCSHIWDSLWGKRVVSNLFANNTFDQECHPSEAQTWEKLHQENLEGCVLLKVLGWMLANCINIGGKNLANKLHVLYSLQHSLIAQLPWFVRLVSLTILSTSLTILLASLWLSLFLWLFVVTLCIPF